MGAMLTRSMSMLKLRVGGSGNSIGAKPKAKA